MKNIILIIISFFLVRQISFAQCNEDRHSTNWYDGWVSCEKDENPNTPLGNSHWIKYNFKAPYKLGKMHIWNINDPKNLLTGIKEAIIDYSMDGDTWTNLGTFILDPGAGQGDYNGFEGPDFGGIEAQYVLITAKSSWGNNQCAGLSEVRFEIKTPTDVETPQEIETASLNVRAFPNPFIYHTNIEVKSNSDEPIFYSITDAFGREIIPETKSIHKNIRLNLTKVNLAIGIYYVKLRQGNTIGNVKITKIK